MLRNEAVWAEPPPDLFGRVVAAIATPSDGSPGVVRRKSVARSHPRRERIGMADEFFLEIDGIVGPSTRRGFEGSIEIESWSWGVSVPMSSGSAGGGGATGRPKLGDLHVTAPISKASPELVKSCVTGRRHRSAVLTGVRSGEAAFDFLRYEFADVLVTAVEHSDTQADVAAEHVALSYRSFEVTFTEQKADGSIGQRTSYSSPATPK